MPLSLVQAASVSSFRSQSTSPILLKPSGLLLQKSIFPGSKLAFQRVSHESKTSKNVSNGSARASLLESPVLWAGRICVFYALVKAGLAGSKSNPFVSGSPIDFSRVFQWFASIVSCFDLMLFDNLRVGKWWCWCWRWCCGSWFLKVASEHKGQTRLVSTLMTLLSIALIQFHTIQKIYSLMTAISICSNCYSCVGCRFSYSFSFVILGRKRIMAYSYPKPQCWVWDNILYVQKRMLLIRGS